MQTAKVEYSGQILVNKGDFPKDLYPHQSKAIQKLDLTYQVATEGLLVLPTGGGKTLTSVYWLLRGFIGKGKKVLWIAHRHELLNQALESIKLTAYKSVVGNRKSFRYRIISGHPKHGRPVHIEPDDDIIIASKDSLNSANGISYLLNQWVNHLDEILVVIDEAHHATAKTYRNLISKVKQDLTKRSCESGFKMLGLTATPFRTSESEKGLLSKVFPSGIIASENLRDLIIKGILAEPIFEFLPTQLPLFQDLSPQEIQAIENSDTIPPHVAEQIARSTKRNRLIVETYLENRERYSPLLVFAVNIVHAIALTKVFNERGKQHGVKAEYVVSQIIDEKTGVTISVKDNGERIQRFRNGEFDVLVNVDILTEGTDLPNIKTVFLTRPTTSSILMTQMVGRALRGLKAGGTEQAYIVSFIDECDQKINWINPKELIQSDGEFIESDRLTNKRVADLISVQKMEEFVRIMDESLDTTKEEKLDFLSRIPLGIYRFSILEEIEGSDLEPIPRNYEVLVYDDAFDAYNKFVNDLGALFTMSDPIESEYPSPAQLNKLFEYAKEVFFPKTYVSFQDEDVKNILRYYAQKEISPEFLAFSDRRKCDLGKLARNVYDQGMNDRTKSEYLGEVWQDQKSFWRVLFSDDKRFFRRQFDIEMLKITDPDIYGLPPSIPKNVIPDDVPIEKLTLNEIKEVDPKLFQELVSQVFSRSANQNGFFTCAITGVSSQMRRDFEIDHIKPMAEGGLSTLDNLQILSIKAHTEKTRQENIQNIQAKAFV